MMGAVYTQRPLTEEELRNGSIDLFTLMSFRLIDLAAGPAQTVDFDIDLSGCLADRRFDHPEDTCPYVYVGVTLVDGRHSVGPNDLQRAFEISEEYWQDSDGLGPVALSPGMTVELPRPLVLYEYEGFDVRPSKTELTLRVGQSETITADVIDVAGKPVDRPVVWSSSNTAVATVNRAGQITGVGVGSATITANATAREGSVEVTVQPR
jgi:hypothetical protein